MLMLQWKAIPYACKILQRGLKMSVIHFICEDLSSYPFDNSLVRHLNFFPADCQTEAAASAQ